MISFIYKKLILLITYYKNTYSKNFIYEMPFSMGLSMFSFTAIFSYRYFHVLILRNIYIFSMLIFIHMYKSVLMII